MTKKTKNKKTSSKINHEDEVKEELSENNSGEKASEDIEALKEELAEANDAKLRALAEVENMRRRMEKEKQENARYGASNLARGIFSVLDNFDRALLASPKDLKNKKDIEKNYISLHEGVELTVKEILNTLNQNGIEVIVPSKGDPFDHNFHQAMLEVPTNEFEPGCICEVLQSGYKIYDRLLRPAMVGVSKKE
ncbi:MAG: nucleotide exchange factor GrpE [Pelagibacterales bacterium]|nr:nucleotide exchange factor GrpE [Pelagibacterales bacterium]PPR16669.1 MAG: Protein GrpE [Alphaproteobacteria bacterium MarineAlpha9_Bin3]|tara:strand:- start:2700 stop:3281 length:582 start_codon:yes stop_codon:yes gene_type:complete